MPSTYAHYRFGKEVLEKINEDEKKIIERNIELYNIGLHGPDILFYFKPIFKNDISKKGHELHDKAGRYFFLKAAKVIKENKFDEKYISYTYGVICHFALDIACHGYIDSKALEIGVSHVGIEADFDRELLVMDGYKPLKHCITKHIKPNLENAEIVSDFYEGVDETKIKKALKSIIFYNNILTTPSVIERKFIFALLKIAGAYDDIHEMFIYNEKNPKCIKSTEKLIELYNSAIENAVKLISEFRESMQGIIPYNDLYSYNFCSKYIEE